ncbi:hypothetical protein Dacet_2130 [Denitrovibrio acetiphilus DSM 12809]|uniref:FeoA family protein n=1 Tax=Denitrovibrio acetiphilus (strain DSM 12809 / NBRC 114555 / N2460) TaxID=522772 RepID=D4H2A1_DENA2|nr:hypothetical protein [Denitrovibrio acetiphilus]ADD68892.1 hypothetical protein Dacet_2130 [Denitrovibrio acetiphilus DSM 12809]
MKLTKARSGGFFTVESINEADLARKLSVYGITSGILVCKINKGDLDLATLKLSTDKGSRTVSGSLARHLYYKSASGQQRSVYEKEQGEELILEIPELIAEEMLKLGIAGGDSVKVLKKLPHMEYVTLVDHRVRCRLSEAHAACILGECEGKEIQFSFARKDARFVVRHIISKDTYANVMEAKGVYEGTVLALEGIEAGRSVHMDDFPDMVLCTADGLRIFISNATAEKITVD